MSIEEALKIKINPTGYICSSINKGANGRSRCLEDWSKLILAENKGSKVFASSFHNQAERQESQWQTVSKKQGS